MAALTITQFQAFAGPQIRGSYLGKVLQLASGSNPFSKKKYSFSSAAGAAATYGIDLVYAEINTLAASGTAAFDLTALRDMAGVSRTFARIKYLYLILPGLDDNISLSAQASAVTLGGNASNGHLMWLANVSDKYVVKTGNYVEVADFSAAGEAVDGTHKAFDVINSDASNIATYGLVIAGSLS